MSPYSAPELFIINQNKPYLLQISDTSGVDIEECCEQVA